MKRVAITGARGFVGANLTRYLLAAGHEVHLLLRPGHSTWRLREIGDDVQIHVVDLLDREALANIVAHVRPEWVFHLAVYGAYSSQSDQQLMIDTNISATANLATVCLAQGCEAFVNTGSSSEYGFVDHSPVEEDYIDPNSYYACTKAAATHLCRYLATEHDAHLPTLRLYSAYGPYEEPTRLVPTLVLRGLRGELPPLVSPDIARDFVYVEDVCRAYVLAASTPRPEQGAVYNVGTGVQTTMAEVVDLARNALGIEAKPEWSSMADRQWDARTWVADSTKIKRELGWRPQCDFAEGFRRTAEWFGEHGDLLPANL